LPRHLAEKLRNITPSEDGKMRYYPCRVTLRTGEVVERVYLAARGSYMETWGVAPEEDPGKHAIALTDVLDLEESADRLPAPFANVLYRAGESGMGYCLFTVVFENGSRQVYVAGNAVDFVPVPKGQSFKSIAAVLPHEGPSDVSRLDGLDYAWCLFEDPEAAA
jgi:hypothetical protein